MHCPFCQSPDSRVVDTRIADDGASIRRRRECTACKHRFTTLETSSFQVVKRSGVVEPFSRNKVVQGVMKACQGRPVDEHDLARLAQQVEEKLRSSGVINVGSDEVGKAILPFLAQLDEIAYLRFASVYLDFNDLDDFEEAIVELRTNAQHARSAKTAPEPTSLAQSPADSEEGDTPSTAPQKKPGRCRAPSESTPTDGARLEPRQVERTSEEPGTDAPASTKRKPKARAKTAETKTTRSAQTTAASSSRKRRTPRKTTAEETMPTLLDS